MDIPFTTHFSVIKLTIHVKKNTHMEGRVSQTFDIGPSLYCMKRKHRGAVPITPYPVVSILKKTQHAALWSYVSNMFKLKKTIEIKLFRLTVVCGKV